ncbi:MAG: DUF2924 domain-containing protein [Parasphingorhabdus sp.]|uniref:DUF2924 domain-containing protein n=1 Tax=Parasphingorhabdus sp. TaxID=2709688 RepID=UPI003262D869
MTVLDDQLAELMAMPPAQLRSAWRDTFKSPAPDIGPDLLRRGIANRLQERVHGSLTGATKREIERLRKRVEWTGKAGYAHAISLKTGTKLVSKGSELRLAIAPDNGPAKHQPDPVLVRLIAKAFAARDYLIDGTTSPMISDYSQRHLRNLARLSFLAPDIITAIVRGSQPVNLTGRRLLRAGDLPLDWAGQRTLLGFE